MENKFEFGDIVYHKESGKGVYLGESSVLYEGLKCVEGKHEVIFNGKAGSDSVHLEDLSNEPFKPEEISFRDSYDYTIKLFNKEVGISIREYCSDGDFTGDEILLDKDDIDLFIEKLQEAKSLYFDN